MRLYDLQRLAKGSGGGEAQPGVGGGRGGDGGCVTLCGHSGPVFGVDYSADGRFLFSGSSDGCDKAAQQPMLTRAWFCWITAAAKMWHVAKCFLNSNESASGAIDGFTCCASQDCEAVELESGPAHLVTCNLK